MMNDNSINWANNLFNIKGENIAFSVWQYYKDNLDHMRIIYSYHYRLKLIIDNNEST